MDGLAQLVTRGKWRPRWLGFFGTGAAGPGERGSMFPHRQRLKNRRGPAQAGRGSTGARPQRILGAKSSSVRDADSLSDA